MIDIDLIMALSMMGSACVTGALLASQKSRRVAYVVGIAPVAIYINGIYLFGVSAAAIIALSATLMAGLVGHMLATIAQRQ